MGQTRFTSFDPEMISSLDNEQIPKKVTRDNDSAFNEYFRKTFSSLQDKPQKEKS